MTYRKNGVKFEIWVYSPNQYGYGVSLVKIDDDGALAGFVLHSFEEEEKQTEYANSLSEMTGFELWDQRS